MYDYRLLDDPLQILSIAKAAFAVRNPEQRAIEEWLASSLEQGRELYGVYGDNSLVSAFMLYDFQMRLRRSVVPMGGIGLLCSRLDARGKGAVRCMLTNSLETMQQKGHTVSVLEPFDESFYRNYGWEKFSRLQAIELSPSALRIPEDPDSEITATDFPFPDDESVAFYNQYATQHHTLAQRQQQEWEKKCTIILPWNEDTAARGVVHFSSDDQVVGLMEYELTRKSGEYMSTFTTNLLAYERDDVLREMLRYLKRLSHQVSIIRMDLPMDCDLWPYLADRPKKWTIRDMFMIRIVSLEAMNGLSIDAPDMTLCIDVDDKQARWNHGIWEILVDSGILGVRRGYNADLNCGIGVLSSVLSGFSSFREMISARRAEPKSSYRGQDLPKATTFLADYF